MHNKGDAVDVKDCATILASVNAPGTSTEFDALLRQVHQYGLTRHEDIQLLLQVYSDDFQESDAHAAYSATLKGALLNDWRLQYTHVTMRWSLISTLVCGVVYAGLKLAMLSEEHTPPPVKMTPQYVAYAAALNLGYVVSYHAFAFGIASSALLVALSAIRLAIVAARTKWKFKMRYTVSWILANVVGFAALVALSLAGFTFPYLILVVSAVLSSMLGGFCCSLDCECRLNGTQLNAVLTRLILRAVPKSARKSLKLLLK
jgi:hypothetical protein